MTNLLAFDPTPAVVTMSSREVADLTGKQHKHVIADCRKLAEFYVETYSAEKSAQLVRSSTYLDSTGRALTCFELSKQAALDLVTGYSLPHRQAVNTRWQELEAQVAKSSFMIPQTLGDALQLAADIERKREAAQVLADRRKVYIEQYKENERQDLALIENQATKIKQLIPAKKFQETFEENGSDMSFRGLAKWLCAGGTAITEPDLSAFLKSRDIMFKLKGKYVPYKQYESTEYFRYTINCAGFGEWAITAAGAVWIKDWIDRARDRKTAA
ncbi:Rha family transcriptional regulator [Paraburkholderia fungorum]|uniref:Rha family transcriptional regulator n=1 Tax=Paraburkholderia fungorum TaxID=134537 RepID=UPI002093D925|nr:Rha family transcriptional regulator [Paraburkholderia fungorum]USU21341.1 phage regulatory protein/antirepressor Ant [Paraburkholderia fungorum]USU26663.1 phage regulatory protein/antirepressor Ant [Paraburkholderia fungorum]